MIRLARYLMPAGARRWLNAFLGFGIQYFGPYATWAEAERHSMGYDQSVILDRVRETSLRVREGEFAYEQDSVGFHQHSRPAFLLAGLADARPIDPARGLNVLDFGGALGSLYHRVLPYLGPLRIKQWLVCEQKRFVECGRAEFSQPPLRFTERPEEAISLGPIDLLILSSVLPYLPDPLNTLRQLALLRPRNILIDRTPLSPEERCYVLVQRTPRSIYRATYPLWLLSRNSIEDVLSDQYTCEGVSESNEGPATCGRIVGNYIGMLWCLRPEA